jgi:thioredoxin reductase (NADPH)
MLIEKDAPGGQAGTSSRIENYLGFPVGLSGGDLARRAVAQARRFGVELLTQEATNIRAEGQYRIVRLADGSELSAHAVLIATGVSYHRLEAPGLDALSGAGVYYGAALSEAINCQGQDILVVGAGNSAGQAAMYFSRYANSVTMIVRGDSLVKSMSQYLIDQIAATPNIQVRVNTEIAEAYGTEHLEAVTIIDKETGQTDTLATPAVFIFIGAHPRTAWLVPLLERDEHGFVLTGPSLADCLPKRWKLKRPPYYLETIVPGIFAVGDVRSGSVKRVATSVGEGAMAVALIHQYLAQL